MRGKVQMYMSKNNKRVYGFALLFYEKMIAAFFSVRNIQDCDMTVTFLRLGKQIVVY